MQSYCYSYKKILRIFDKSIANNKQLRPCIIYGQHGIGKSHLSSKIADKILIDNKTSKFEYDYSPYVARITHIRMAPKQTR